MNQAAARRCATQAAERTGAIVSIAVGKPEIVDAIGENFVEWNRRLESRMRAVIQEEIEAFCELG